MKLSILTLFPLVSVVNGFSSAPISSTRSFGLLPKTSSLSAEAVSATESGEGDIYQKLGFEEEKIAIGIDPKDVLEYLGT